MVAIIARPCDNCQEIYDAEVRYLNRGQGRFCSRKCSGEHKSKSTEPLPSNVSCSWCGASYRIKPSLVGVTKYVFCSTEHQNLAAADKGHPYSTGPESSGDRIYKCPECSKPWNSWTHSKYDRCPKCRLQLRINQWLSGNLEVTYVGTQKDPASFVKQYLIDTRGDRCEVCGFDEKHPTDGRSIITMDHIDGNYLNNLIENLKLLCPNHHALTPTYGARNKNGGRRYRAKNYVSNSWK